MIEYKYLGKPFLLLFIIALSYSCSNPKQEEKNLESTNTDKKKESLFNESKWKTKKGKDYPFRDTMLNDLISDYEFREYKRDKILALLGEPDRIDSNYLFYMVTQKRIGFWPLHTKTLVINLSADSTINWMKIHE